MSELGTIPHSEHVPLRLGIHPTVKITGRVDADETIIEEGCVIVGDGFYFTDSLIGAYTTIHANDVWLELHHVYIPPFSYVEWENKLGSRCGIGLIYTPNDGIFVKPGCRPIEPIEATLDRMHNGRIISGWQGVKKAKRNHWRQDIIEYLENAKTYEWTQ